MNEMKRHQLSNLLFTVILVIGLVFGKPLVAKATTSGCSEGKITGAYECSVSCIARDDNDGLKGFTDPFIDSGEIDTIETFVLGEIAESDEMYKVEIVNGGFTETEIGPLVGCTLYTATESVSDNQFPVLEEYIFDESSGSVNSFTKVVRNPSRGDFKTCKVQCNRQN